MLGMGYLVRGLDNYSMGHRENVADALASAEKKFPGASENFEMIEGDVTDRALCERACAGAAAVFHLAALASVPGSIENPAESFRVNVQGFVSVLEAARMSGVRRVVYASSSAVYGDSPSLPKIESDIGLPLSPYALTKWMDEEIAGLYVRLFGMECVGLRYFNVFGPRQDPMGAYAAVIPRWFDALTRGERPVIYGDGETSRDFCYIDNVVDANIRAAVSTEELAFGESFNIACGERTTLNELFSVIRDTAGASPDLTPIYEDFRLGDVRHSLASAERAKKILGWAPEVDIREGLRRAAAWYLRETR
jgi:UDP-N-acetylglucosamine 4-epimerase